MVHPVEATRPDGPTSKSKALTVQIKAGLRIKLIQTEIDNTGLFINVDHLLTENFIIGIAKAQIEIEVEDRDAEFLKQQDSLIAEKG